MKMAASAKLLLALLFLAFSWKNDAQAPSPIDSPAPAPSPLFVNITQVLTSAGQFSSFLKLISEAKQTEAFQAQANNTETGITIFAPTDKAFASPPASVLLRNLTQEQEVAIAGLHALTSFHPLSSLQQTSETPLSNFAGYKLNGTDEQGTVFIVTVWSRAQISSTLYNSLPASLFAIDEVLLPEEIFGIPLPAPAPAPSLGAPTPSPELLAPGASSSSSSLAPSASHKNDAPVSLFPLKVLCLTTVLTIAAIL